MPNLNSAASYPHGLLPPDALFAQRPAPSPAAPLAPSGQPPTQDQLQAPASPAGQAQAVLHFQDMTLPEPVRPSQAEQDFSWVQQLEQKLGQGYQPTADEIRRYNDVQFQLAVNGAPQPTPPPTTVLSAEELQWAQQLEQKTVQGYQPSASESARYQELLQRVQGQSPAATPQAPIAPSSTPATPPDAVSAEEFQWAQQLHQRVAQGYQPTSEEVQRYEAIAARLESSPQQVPDRPPGITQTEYDWAVQLEQRVNQGYQPSSEEVQRYEQLMSRIADSSQEALNNLPPDAPFSREDILWAQEIEQRVTQGYQPTAEEVQRYETLSRQVQRFQS